MYGHTFSRLANHEIRHQATKWAVSLVIAYGHLPQGFVWICIWVNILTITPKAFFFLHAKDYSSQVPSCINCEFLVSQAFWFPSLYENIWLLNLKAFVYGKLIRYIPGGTSNFNASLDTL